MNCRTRSSKHSARNTRGRARSCARDEAEIFSPLTLRRERTRNAGNGVRTLTRTLSRCAARRSVGVLFIRPSDLVNAYLAKGSSQR